MKIINKNEYMYVDYYANGNISNSIYLRFNQLTSFEEKEEVKNFEEKLIIGI